jgi:dihydropteroate synthase
LNQTALTHRDHGLWLGGRCTWRRRLILLRKGVVALRLVATPGMMGHMTELVGILNITPDSFSDGGMFIDARAALEHADQLFAEGVSLVDVGAESTRPGATPLAPDEEWKRLEPVLGTLVHDYPGRISLDTYHPETAERALAMGDVIINDITGMNNPGMVEVVTRHRAQCIISNLPAANPQAAHQGVLLDDAQIIVDDLLAKVALLRAGGLPEERIIVDPGIGFGKTPELNEKLLEFPRLMPGYQVMIGYSRKRFLGEQRMELAPNLAAAKVAIAAGAAYLRVHDVAGHVAGLKQLLY